MSIRRKINTRLLHAYADNFLGYQKITEHPNLVLDLDDRIHQIEGFSCINSRKKNKFHEKHTTLQKRHYG